MVDRIPHDAPVLVIGAMSAFVMLQFGPDVARVTIRGAAFTYMNSKNPRTRTELADEHGAPALRV